MKYPHFLLLFLIVPLVGCSKHDDAVAIDENTFVYGSKVYRIIDNEVMQISDLNSETMRKFDVNNSLTRDFGKASLEYIKAGASATVTASYRNNKMYYKFQVEGLSDLKEKYYRGNFFIEFFDSLGYTIHQIPLETSDLEGDIGADNHTVIQFSHNGTSEILFHTFERIKHYSVASTVRKLLSASDYLAPEPAPRPSNPDFPPDIH